MPPRKVLLDCDPGVDDALALLLALFDPRAELLAVTTVAGNAPLDVCTRNALRILDASGRDRVPRVHAGAAFPLGGRAAERATHIHGPDGLGGLDPDRYPDPGGSAVPPPAHEALIGWARRLPGEITLVAAGPLTNLALAARDDPEALGWFRDIVVMGGAVRTPGNVTPAAEFNIWSDPEAAGEVLGRTPPLILVPLDVTRQAVLLRADLDRLPAGRPLTRFVRDCTRVYMDFHRAHRGIDGCLLHDPLAMGVALDPSLVTTEEIPLRVVTSQGPERGRTEETRPERGSAVRVCTAVEADRFLDDFLSKLGG